MDYHIKVEGGGIMGATDLSYPEAWNRSPCDTASIHSEPTSTYKSTKGASKIRRDLINAEVAILRDLLPLPASTRQRMSQLQLMALVCVYLRKANYFQQLLKTVEHESHPPPQMGFSKALNGFLLLATQTGKLLYISENAAEYLGHSMEDLLIHGDSLYDIIDKQDHQAIQTELMRAPAQSVPPTDDARMFLCRMNVSRNARRQMRFGDQKVVLVRGQYLSYLPLCSRNEPVFVATCTPIAMPETRECVAQGATNVFTSVHSMDMKFLHLDTNGEFYLGYENSAVQNLSWYELLHWENLREVQTKHKLICASEQDRSCILLLRLQARSGHWLWAHCVLQVKDNMENMQQPAIVCTCQVLSEHEAAVMRANSWLYHYYSMQGKLQYSLAYETHPRMNAYYQQMLGYPAAHQDTSMYPTYIPGTLSAHHTDPATVHGHHLSPHVMSHVTPQYSFPTSAYHHYPVLESSPWERYDSGYLPHVPTEPRIEQPTPIYQAALTPPSLPSPQKRPPTPPESPRRKLCAPTVVPPASSPTRDAVPIKRRLMAYQQQQQHPHPHPQPEYSSGHHGGGWSDRGSGHHRAPPQRVQGQYGYGTTVAGDGDVLVQRAAPLRLHTPLKEGLQALTELEPTQEPLPWTLSPPWSESSQRVPDVSGPQASVTPPGDTSVGTTHPDAGAALTGWAGVCSVQELHRPPQSSPSCSESSAEEEGRPRTDSRRAWTNL